MARSRLEPIRYQRKGYQPQLLITSLVDETSYPADEVRALYHERWEIELGFGEIKTDMLERLETIRSKSPDAVAHAAACLQLDPTRDATHRG